MWDGSVPSENRAPSTVSVTSILTGYSGFLHHIEAILIYIFLENYSFNLDFPISLHRAVSSSL